MTLGQAFGYFLKEAAVNLLRSWKVSLVAILTIGVSLFVGGTFLVLSNNLAELVQRWQDETKVSLYLEPNVADADLQALVAEISREPWVQSVDHVDRKAAKERFQAIFPSLAELVSNDRDEPLPASLEVAIRPQAGDSSALDSWITALRQRPGIEMVDDDREWLGQLATVVALGRGLGMALGLILLAAAVFTIASVVRLTAYLYYDEIAIMRLVGATEFFIRGPFYAEGLIQGFLGGLLAVACLLVGYQVAVAKVAGSAWGGLLLLRFLGPLELLALVLLGATAGLVGAVVSLRKERLGEPESA